MLNSKEWTAIRLHRDNSFIGCVDVKFGW